MSKGRIDVHQHIVPPFWAEALSAHGGDPSGWSSPAWTPENAIDFMDSQRIAMGILSLTAPGVTGWQGAARRDMARRVNEFGAQVVARRPDRFGGLATLPLPDVDGALRELEYAFDTLNADGVVLLSNYAGHYLGDPAFGPLWAELERRSAVVFIHPAKPAIPVIVGIPGPTVRTDVPATAELLESFRSFYFDTALSSSPASLLALQSFARPGHILYGSDFPYASASIGASFTAKLDAFENLSREARTAIDNGGARKLLPRLSADAAGYRVPLYRRPTSATGARERPKHAQEEGS